MDIVRNADGTLVVPVEERRPDRNDDSDAAAVGDDRREEPTDAPPATRVLHPGEGGYDEALAQWDLQQNPDRGAAVSTPTGRQEAMTLIHAVGASPDHEVTSEVAALDDPEAAAEALRHVLVGGAPSVEAFAAEVAEAKGGDPLTAHQATKIIGEVLAELD